MESRCRQFLAVIFLATAPAFLHACSSDPTGALKSPRFAIEVTDAGTVVLDGGVSVSVPGLAALRGDREVLDMLLRNGIEIAEDGSVFVAVDVYSDCDRSASTDGTRRVLLDSLLAFIVDPRTLRAESGPPVGVNRKGIHFGTWLAFERWQGER